MPVYDLCEAFGKDDNDTWYQLPEVNSDDQVDDSSESDRESCFAGCSSSDSDSELSALTSISSVTPSESSL